MASNKSNKKEGHAWQEVSRNYSKFIVPNRPSQEDCENYGQFIAKTLKGKKSPKIMVMGSTPELRSILLQYEILNKAEVYCVDLNYSMYQAMTDFMAQSNLYNEKYVKASWLDTKLPDKYFDLVVGDEVVCNIDSAKHQNLFEEISRVLKKNGVWITKIEAFFPGDGKKGEREALVDIARKVDIGRYSLHFATLALYAEIYCSFGKDKNLANTMKNVYKALEKEFNQNLKKHKYGKIIKELLRLFKENWVVIAGDYRWYFLSKQETEKELQTHFHIEEMVCSSDNYTVENSPIYLLRRK